MIVNCPSCRTRYRYASQGADAAHRGRCSRCDAEFALAPAKRSYLLCSTGTQVAEVAQTFPIHAAAADPRGGGASHSSLATWFGLLLGSVGALVGYYAALFQSGDVILWTATGCAAGLSAGALWSRWQSRKH